MPSEIHVFFGQHFLVHRLPPASLVQRMPTMLDVETRNYIFTAAHLSPPSLKPVAHYLAISTFIDPSVAAATADEPEARSAFAARPLHEHYSVCGCCACTAGVNISKFEGYDLGLKAERDFESGSLLLTVPKKLMMTEKDAKESELGPFISQDPLLQNMPNITLALFILLQKSDPGSFWKPYIEILPEKYTTVLYFTAEELINLKVCILSLAFI
ncbi:Histone-lysine N-methyltransferase setd3 [Eumeta japonica]|uniref:Histone-lysine N-methyltransferase setd3 n=1 Tax=Eumeta variegata TaxID=151549 RepID=A0A4C1WFJ7_EUMVA|nr:Histone-lysine N-methyltransferase setd3 [Eumeta japonica]